MLNMFQFKPSKNKSESYKLWFVTIASHSDTYSTILLNNLTENVILESAKGYGI